MSVWFVCPSKRPPEERDPILKLWRERGYKVALWLDGPPSCVNQLLINHWTGSAVYPGYAAAVNSLVNDVIGDERDAQWIVCAGDDTEPDAQHSAEEIAQQCEEYFLGDYLQHNQSAHVAAKLRTFGVMQPTGDRWGEDPNNNNPAWRSAYIDRVAGSPWMGREFCLRVNQGRGPLWPDYYHCFADEELQNVATRLGVFWQRPDLIHLHKHWGRVPNGAPMPSSDLMPDFLKRANSREEWRKAENLFKQRQAVGFPGSEPL